MQSFQSSEPPPKKKAAKARPTPDTADASGPPRNGAKPAAGGHSLPSDRTNFAHESERQFARLLDFYQIAWEYEPKTFDVEWDADGNVIKQFSPDFWLPEFQLFIEITTMNQKLVTKKNRKVRRLRELYPGTNIKIFYQRDYVKLLAKYGLAKSSGLSSG